MTESATKKTSAEWWAEVRVSPELTLDWLKKQYHGEITAASRMRDFIYRYGEQAKDPKWIATVSEIAQQEEAHGGWIGNLLQARGVTPATIPGRTGRYWDATLPGIESWESGCAVSRSRKAQTDQLDHQLLHALFAPLTPPLRADLAVDEPLELLDDLLV